MGHLETQHFPNPLLLGGLFGVSHLSGCKIASPVPCHFRFLNSAPGCLSKPVIGSFRGGACCVSVPLSIFILESTHTRTHFLLQNVPILLISKPLQGLHLKNGHPFQSHLPLCVANSKYNVRLETRALSTLF